MATKVLPTILGPKEGVTDLLAKYCTMREESVTEEERCEGSCGPGYSVPVDCLALLRRATSGNVGNVLICVVTVKDV